MNFRDMRVHCEECGKDYFFTVEQQRRMAERGLEVTVPDVCDACRQRVQYGGKLHGQVKWFDAEKGYGFIAADDGKEIFFHRSGVAPDEQGEIPAIEEGQEVLYEAGDSPKGPQATHVAPFQVQ